jgi:hypothetical protein
MKAISLWQPWATLMAIGAKKNETRGRRTHVRGDIVICSAKRVELPSLVILQQLYELASTDPALRRSTAWAVFNSLPFGYALCVVTLHGCVPTEVERHVISAIEERCGNYEDGRFAWQTGNLRPFNQPFPIKGSQGWFDIPDEMVRRALS